MIGMCSWIGVGALAGFLTTRLMARQRDMSGLVLFTIVVGTVGSLGAGFGAMGLGVGNMAAVSLYSLLFATLGACVALVAFCWLTRSADAGEARRWGNSQ
jgi:uncharacterized membrane protein YeaQ/YmgE (transglycosylase-associated protein family)